MASSMTPIVIEDVLSRMNLVMPMTYSNLKSKQKEAILKSRENDVLTILPTGYGKTVIIQALPFLSKERPKAVIIINALNGIMEEQKTRFGGRCLVLGENVVKSLEEDPSEKVVERIWKKDETLNYILCHPEVIVKPSVKKALMSISDRISHIVVDEAHCVLSWGNSSFRPAYQKLGLLRAIFPNALIHALTATSTKENQKNIIESLRMREPQIIVESPDRPNVFLQVKIRPPSTGGENTTEDAMHAVVDPILKNLKDRGLDFEKTIIYVPLKWCGQLHYRAESQFNIAAHTEKDTIKLTATVGQYHSPQSQTMKSMIVKNMKEKDGSLRLLFATEAYGMGMDVDDIINVIHVGPPNTIETFVQEIGRCGRNGQDATATLYYNKTDISANNSHLDEHMKIFCTTSDCRRKLILDYFGFDLRSEHLKHKCCDNCAQICSCDACKSSHEHGSDTQDHEKGIATKFSKKQTETATFMLNAYFQAENSVFGTNVLPHIRTGLSDHLAKSVASESAYSDEMKLESDFPLLRKDYITNIAKIISQVKLLKL